MKEDWNIEPDETGNAFGKITHRKIPRFSAQWSTGPDMPPDITGLCWSDDGSGEEDQIHIFGFHWTENPPDQKRFEALMQEAVQFIDGWIAKQM